MHNYSELNSQNFNCHAPKSLPRLVMHNKSWKRRNSKKDRRKAWRWRKWRHQQRKWRKGWPQRNKKSKYSKRRWRSQQRKGWLRGRSWDQRWRWKHQQRRRRQRHLQRLWRRTQVAAPVGRDTLSLNMKMWQNGWQKSSKNTIQSKIIKNV